MIPGCGYDDERWEEEVAPLQARLDDLRAALDRWLREHYTEALWYSELDGIYREFFPEGKRT